MFDQLEYLVTHATRECGGPQVCRDCSRLERVRQVLMECYETETFPKRKKR